MKKAVILLMCLIMILSSSITLGVSADGDIKIVIDDVNQTYDQMPVIRNDRTLVPLRGIFEALGANVDWYDETKTIIGSKEDKTVVLQVGNTAASMNNKKVTMDVSPDIINSRTMVPVRFISEALGAKVEWIADTRTVVITSAEKLLADKEELRFKNGEVVLDEGELIRKTRRNITGGAEATLEYVEDKLYVNVKKTTAKDMDVLVTFKTPIGGVIKQSDVCLMTFKARLISGGDENGGYVKVWVQNESTTKPLFARTRVASSEWTDCYLPFIGIENMSNLGFRLGGAVQEIEIKDFNLINYGPKKNIKTLKSTVMRGENTVAKVFEDDETSTDDAPVTEEKAAESTTPAISSTNGTVIIDSAQFKKSSTHTGKGCADFKFENDVLKVNVHTLPEKDLNAISTINIPLSDIIKQSDICLMTFKARLSSGGTDGVGYIKAWVQNDSSTKALFARTRVGSEWTDCYLPFVGIANLSNMGFRYGGAVQGLELKDFKVTNYGPDKNIKTLKSTVMRGDNTVASVYEDDETVAEDTADAGINLDSIPAEGIVILGNKELTTNYTTNIKGYADVKVENDVFNINVHTLPSKDLQATIALKTPLKDLIRQSDVCLMTFKARITSGGTDGVGYIKAFVQNDTNGKALFARTNVGTEWTECHLPFIGISNMNNMGMRFGGAVQNVEIKDFKVINYGPDKDIKTLKTTVLKDDNTVAPLIP